MCENVIITLGLKYISTLNISNIFHILKGGNIVYMCFLLCQRGNNRYTFGTSNTTINSSAYANDLASLAHEFKSLQIQINKVDRFCEWSRMDVGVPKCAITGCPNKFKMNSTTFKAHL